MPRYLYTCKSCKVSVEAVHSYKERLSHCLECGDEKGLYRDLSIPITTKPSVQKRHQKVGSETKEAIEQARQEVKISKQNLKKRKLK